MRPLVFACSSFFLFWASVTPAPGGGVVLDNYECVDQISCVDASIPCFANPPGTHCVRCFVEDPEEESFCVKSWAKQCTHDGNNQTCGVGLGGNCFTPGGPVGTCVLIVPNWIAVDSCTVPQC